MGGVVDDDEDIVEWDGELSRGVDVVGEDDGDEVRVVLFVEKDVAEIALYMADVAVGQEGAERFVVGDDAGVGVSVFADEEVEEGLDVFLPIAIAVLMA